MSRLPTSQQQSLKRPFCKHSPKLRPLFPENPLADASSQERNHVKSKVAQISSSYGGEARPKSGRGARRDGLPWTTYKADKFSVFGLAQKDTFVELGDGAMAAIKADVTGLVGIGSIGAAPVHANFGGGGGAPPVHRRPPSARSPPIGSYCGPGTCPILEAVRNKSRASRSTGPAIGAGLCGTWPEHKPRTAPAVLRSERQVLIPAYPEDKPRTAPAVLRSSLRSDFSTREYCGDAENTGVTLLDILQLGGNHAQQAGAGGDLSRVQPPYTARDAGPTSQKYAEAQVSAQPQTTPNTGRSGTKRSVTIKVPEAPSVTGHKGAIQISRPANLEMELQMQLEMELQSRVGSKKQSLKQGLFAQSCRKKQSPSELEADEQLPDVTWLERAASVARCEAEAQEAAAIAKKHQDLPGASGSHEQRMDTKDMAALRRGSLRTWQRSGSIANAASRLTDAGKKEGPNRDGDDGRIVPADIESFKTDQSALLNFLHQHAGAFAESDNSEVLIGMATLQARHDERMLASKHNLSVQEVAMVQYYFRQLGGHTLSTKVAPDVAEKVLRMALGQLFHDGSFQGAVTGLGTSAMDLNDIVEWLAFRAFDMHVMVPAENMFVREIARKWGINFTEVEDLHVKFARYDTDGSGLIDRSEFFELIQSMLKMPAGFELPKSRMDFFWKEADRDGDGIVSFEEFFAWYRRYFSTGKNCGSGEDFMTHYMNSYKM